MSLARSSNSDDNWFENLLGVPLPAEGQPAVLGGVRYLARDGVLRQESLISTNQEQTKETFGFKWKKRQTFESDASLERMGAWLRERYGDVEVADWWSEYTAAPVVVDAGCGAGMSGLEVFGNIMGRIHYVGVDISEAVDVAAARCAEKKLPAKFVQADITKLPFPRGSVDVIFSEGVLHHTDSTEEALKSLAEYLKPGGRFLFYVYRKKGPIREFTDDYIRERISSLAAEEAWELLMPLSELGKALGDLDISIDIPTDIEVLSIPQGRITLQRLFYWHIFKCFYHPEYDLEEMNHINFDWYAPANAHRQSAEDIRRWCVEAGLTIERIVEEEAGITVVARKS